MDLELEKKKVRWNGGMYALTGWTETSFVNEVKLIERMARGLNFLSICFPLTEEDATGGIEDGGQAKRFRGGLKKFSKYFLKGEWGGTQSPQTGRRRNKKKSK